MGRQQQRQSTRFLSTRLRRGALGFLSFLLFVLAGIVLLEVGLRLTGSQSDFFFQLDPEVGAIHIPGKKGWLTFDHGRQYIEINRHGYRDRERSLEKPPSSFRIAVLGDSFVEAFQVPLEDAFTILLENKLNRECRSQHQFEVLNFGVSGFGTAQEMRTLQYRVRPFHPDLVLLFFYPSNDIYDNSHELGVETNRLYFRLDEDGGLVELPYFVADYSWKKWLRKHSKAYLFLRDRIKRVQALRRALTRLELMQPQVSPETKARREALIRLQNNQYRKPPAPAVTRSWELTEALLAETERLAGRIGAGFGMVVIPNKEEILGWGEWGQEDPASWDFEQSLRRADEICQRLGLDCLQLVSGFRAAGRPWQDYYFPSDGHWTKAGHALVAGTTFQWLAPVLCDEGEGS